MTKLGLKNPELFIEWVPSRVSDHPTKSDYEKADVIAASVSNCSVELLYEYRKRITYTIVTRQMGKSYTYDLEKKGYITSEQWCKAELLQPVYKVGLKTTPACRSFNLPTADLLDALLETVTDPATHPSIYYDEDMYKSCREKVFSSKTAPPGFYKVEALVKKRCVDVSLFRNGPLPLEKASSIFEKAIERAGGADVLDNFDDFLHSLKTLGGDFFVSGGESISGKTPVKLAVAGSGGLMQAPVRGWGNWQADEEFITDKPVRMSAGTAPDIYEYLCEKERGKLIITELYENIAHLSSSYGIFGGGNTVQEEEVTSPRYVIVINEYTMELRDEGSFDKITEAAVRARLVAELAGKSESVSIYRGNYSYFGKYRKTLKYKEN